MEDPPTPTPDEHEQAPELQEEHESMGGQGQDDPEAPPAVPPDE